MCLSRWIIGVWCRHALDVRSHYEQKLQRLNNLYTELSSVLHQLDLREQRLAKWALKPRSQWRQSWQSTKRRQTDLSPIRSTLSRIFSTLLLICRQFVDSWLSPAHSTLSNVLHSTLSTVLRSILSPKLNVFNLVDFVESGSFLSPECRASFRLCC